MPKLPFVAVAVATYRRPDKVQRLLQTLALSTVPIGVVIVDNADDPETASHVESFTAFEAVRLFPGSNLGCGGGLAYGQREALARWGEKITHLATVDDDAELCPDVFEKLIAALEAEGATLACPMILGPTGETGWLPGFLERDPFNYLRGLHPPQTPENYLNLFGASPRPIYYSTGVTVLVTRAAFDKLGSPFTNYWIQGEDIEYTLRYTAHGKGIFVPEAVIRHIPPPDRQDQESKRMIRSKEMAMLQNCSFISFHLPHGRRILRHLPGNFYRAWKNWGFKAVPRMLRAFARGAILKKPAGMTPRL